MVVIQRNMTLVDSLDERDYLHEKRALKALLNSDACIYLTTTETVPDPSHTKELELIRLANPHIVGVINKTAGSSNKRVRPWIDAMQASGVGEVFEFDAHWDRYSKLDQIFGAIGQGLPVNKRKLFEDNLASFKKSLAETQKRIAERAAGCLLACRSISASRDTEKDRHSKDVTTKGLKIKVIEELAECLADFAEQVLRYYQIAVSGVDHSNPSLSESVFRGPGARIGEMAKHGAVGGGIGAVIGCAIGLMLGPAGWAVTAMGALAAAQAGAGVGASVGLLSGAATTLNETITVQLSENDLKDVAVSCLAIVWCATHHGFGQGDTASAESYGKAVSFVKAKIGRTGYPQWKTCTEERMTKWFLEQINLLDL